MALILPASPYALDNPEGEIANVIEDYITAKYPDWSPLDIQISFMYAEKTFQSLKELTGDIEYKIMETYKDFKPVGNVIFPIEVVASGSNRKIFLRSKVEVHKDIIVAANKINRGDVIDADDLTLEGRDISMFPARYFSQLDEVISHEAKTSISRNSTIFDWMIKEVPLVHRGENISIYVTAPNLLVRAEGVALSDGYLGGKMTVKSKSTNKSMEGILVSANEVEVKVR